MKRSPSAVQAGHHLLRHLDNPTALRRNELVSDLFAGAARHQLPSVSEHVVALAAEALESLKPGPLSGHAAAVAARHYAILARYELAGHARAAVARDLGIGTRKFYYERRAALERFAEELDVAKNRAPLKIVSGNLEDERRHALKLSQLGEFDAALKIFMELAKEAPGAMERIRLFCQIVDTLCEAGRAEQALAFCTEGRRALQMSALEEREALLLQAQLDFACAKIHSQRGNFKEAQHMAERARASVIASGIAGEPGRLFFAELLGWLGSLLTLFGRLPEAIEIYDQAVSIVESCKSPTSLLADLLWQQARCYSLMPGGMVTAREKNAEALDLATRASNLHTLARAHVSESVFRYWGGQLTSALDHGRLAMAVANRISGPEERGLAALVLARIEAASGDGRRALRRIEAARIGLPAGCYLSIFSHIVQSGILLALHEDKGAIRSAKVAANRSRKTGSSKGLGAATHLLAEAQDRCGNERGAAAAIRIAVAELEHAGDPFSLAAAYECSARLTGNRNHLANTSDLRAMLACPSGWTLGAR
ncbi:MAG: hypothetical protein GIX03_02400 [Candidatus Eremiobacteraeota bacterium]|nr:hypothetical protein [Candidatus Eremiobacteraeota bacterium]